MSSQLSGSGDGTTDLLQSNIPDLLMGEMVRVRVVVARSRMKLQDIVKLAPSSVMQLESTVAREVEVEVNGRVMAWGEVVAVSGCYGVRLTRIAGADRREVSG